LNIVFNKKLFNNIVQRIFTAWISTCLVFSLFSDGSISLPEFAEGISILRFVCFFAVFFSIFTSVGIIFEKFKVDNLCFILVAILYALTIVAQNRNVYFALGVVAIVSVCWVYCIDHGGFSFENRYIKSGISFLLMVFPIIFFLIFTGGVTVLRYLTFSTPNFDFGIFVNMFHNMKESFLPNVTCERDVLLSHFAVHVSPIYYLILPFYVIFPSPITLQVAQAVILASAAIPLYLLARHLNFSKIASSAMCAVLCFYPALCGGCFYDIHENCFLVPLLLWMFYFYEKRKFVPFYVFVVLVMFVKEDAPVYIAFFALFMILSRKDTFHGFIVFLMAIAYFAGVTYLLDTYGRGVMTYRYNNYTVEYDASLLTVVINIVKDPSLVLKHIITAEKIPFILSVLVPLGFTPFVTKDPSKFILCGPMLLINLMPTYIYQYDIYFQYVFGSLAFLFYASVLNIKDMNPKSAQKILPVMVSASIIFFSATSATKSYYFDSFKQGRESNRLIAQVLDNIPEDVSVRSSTFFLARIADRDEIYAIDTVNETEYTVLDMRYPSHENAINIYNELMSSEDYVLVEEELNLIAVFKKVAVNQ